MVKNESPQVYDCVLLGYLGEQETVASSVALEHGLDDAFCVLLIITITNIIYKYCPTTFFWSI